MNQIIYVSGRKDLIVSVQYSDQFVLSCIDSFQALIKELFPFCDRCYFHISTINPLRFLRFQKQVVKLLKHFTNETLILGDHSWLVLAFNPSFLYRFTSSGQIVGKLPVWSLCPSASAEACQAFQEFFYLFHSGSSPLAKVSFMLCGLWCSIAWMC